MKFEFLPKNDKNVPWAKHFQMFPGFDTMNQKNNDKIDLNFLF